MTLVTIPATKGGAREYNHIIARLLEDGFTITSRRRKSGYLSRKIHALISPYSGRYGTGFAIEKPAFDNTGMHWIQYAIKPETADK